MTRHIYAIAFTLLACTAEHAWGQYEPELPFVSHDWQHNTAWESPRLGGLQLTSGVVELVDPPISNVSHQELEELPPGSQSPVDVDDVPRPPHPDLPPRHPHQPPCNCPPKHGLPLKGGKGGRGGLTPGFVLYGEFLHRKTYSSDPQYVAVQGSGTLDFPNPSIRGENLGMDFDHDSGIRLGANWLHPCGWEVTAQGTFFENRAWTLYEDNNLAAPGGGLVPTETHSFVVLATGLRGPNSPATPDNPLGLAELVIPVQSAEGHSNIDHQVFDLQIGQHMPVSPNVLLRPYGGFRYASLKQNSTFTYLTDPDDAIGAGWDRYIVEDIVRHRSEMDAYGLHGGCDLYWDICQSGFSFYGRSAVSLLMGDFRVSRHETAMWTNPDISGTFELDKVDEFKQVVPVFDVGAGLRYNHHRFFASVGYEFEYWMNSFNRLKPASDTVLSSFDLDRGGLGFGAVRLSVGGAW